MSDLMSLLCEAKQIAQAQVTEGITSPEQVAALVMSDMAKLEQEELWVIQLNARNIPILIDHVCKGSTNTALIRMGELFKEAVRQNAVSIIAIHNHPSGDPSPSPEDIALTRDLEKAGRLLDIPLLDHLVIGKGSFVSLKEKGLGFD